jgi:hypothetical protein
MPRDPPFKSTKVLLGLDIERSLQDAAQAHPMLVSAMNYFYMFSHLPSVIAFFVGLKVCARIYSSDYLDRKYLCFRTYDPHLSLIRLTHNTDSRFVLMNIMAISIYTLYPCAPPRLTKSVGLADTIKERIGLSPYEEIASQVNPYAAMPSMHFGYSWFFATSLIDVLQLPWSSWKTMLLCGYPTVMFFAIQATGNHFLLDAVGGFLVVTSAICLQYWIEEKWRKNTNSNSILPTFSNTK